MNFFGSASDVVGVDFLANCPSKELPWLVKAKFFLFFWSETATLFGVSYTSECSMVPFQGALISSFIMLSTLSMSKVSISIPVSSFSILPGLSLVKILRKHVLAFKLIV